MTSGYMRPSHGCRGKTVMRQNFREVIIIGAGAAGLMCAAEAGRRGRSVLVLDHAGVTGRKVRRSGGGRCNFANLSTSPRNYLSSNRRFCTSALARFGPEEFVALVKKHSVRYHSEGDRLFCDGRSLEIMRMLEEECSRSSVEVRLNCRILRVTKEKYFTVDTSLGRFHCQSLVVATGGVSFRQLGATDFGYRLAHRFGLNVTPIRPALVPLLWSRNDRSLFGALAGISLQAAVTCRKETFLDGTLFTHEGLSGPAILQASLFWTEGTPLVIDLMPGEDPHELFLSKRTQRVEMHNLLAGYLPKRFVQTWLDVFSSSKPLNLYSDRELRKIAGALHRWEVVPAGTAGFSKAEVTLGGIDTRELSSKTMEAKKVAGLYFLGEVIDVTGQLGGYNLQWAWSSGYAAGQFV